MVELARGNGMRIIGPASMGVINTDPTSPLHASFAPLDVPAGRRRRCRSSPARSARP